MGKSMTFDEFKEFVTSLGISAVQDPESLRRNRYSHKESPLDVHNHIFVEWSTGGYSGGSCWDDSNPQPYTSENAREELVEFDSILEKICPSLSFSDYKKIRSEVVTSFYRTEHEYYGNQTDYEGLKCDLKDLFDVLKSRSII